MVGTARGYVYKGGEKKGPRVRHRLVLVAAQPRETAGRIMHQEQQVAGHRSQVKRAARAASSRRSVVAAHNVASSVVPSAGCSKLMYPEHNLLMYPEHNLTRRAACHTARAAPTMVEIGLKIQNTATGSGTTSK